MGRLKRGERPRYRHHRSSGQAVITIAGRDIYLGKFDTLESRTRYAQVIEEFARTGWNAPIS
ncbi:hypothetical protein V7x_14950 [Crateriforma conspicua]|uniref:AP2/ERF domain-containing protein n=1 Tax=Crateriforma conspicua TaxID=2527996 RepID=A0A5C6FUC1_9PLAN|nr:hypothetical protein V7x_14950 [Crateriforma conspicua]